MGGESQRLPVDAHTSFAPASGDADGSEAPENDTMWTLLGNSGKPVTLEMSSLTKFSKYVFQEQGIRDSRKPGTCAVTNSRMCGIRESGFGEKAESRTCGSPESQLLMVRTSGNCRFGNLMKTLFGTQTHGHARTCREARATSGIC
jgi:hypothetical protein